MFYPVDIFMNSIPEEQPLMVSAECQEAIDQRHRCLGSLLNSSLDYERLALESFLMGSVVARDIETLVRRDLGDSMGKKINGNAVRLGSVST